MATTLSNSLVSDLVLQGYIWVPQIGPTRYAGIVVTEEYILLFTDKTGSASCELLFSAEALKKLMNSANKSGYDCLASSEQISLTRVKHRAHVLFADPTVYNQQHSQFVWDELDDAVMEVIRRHDWRKRWTHHIRNMPTWLFTRR